MEILSTALPDVLLLKTRVFEDARGFFLESYNQQTFDKLGIKFTFVQDNYSSSIKNVLRGLHYQMENAQGKLVRVTRGEVFDVAVDMRKNSVNYGKWAGFHLSETNQLMAWIPPGFAHGFLALSDRADVAYKVTAPYHPQSDRSLLWNDPDLAIKWPLKGEPLLSDKDAKGALFKNADSYK